MSQVVCAVVGHQPNRRHVWNDSINARTACKRCGFPMLRDLHAGWRAFEPRSDHDVRRLAYPGVNVARTGLFTARSNGAAPAAAGDAAVLERDALHDESVTTRLEPGIARSNHIVSHESFFPAVDDAILLPHYDLATIARAGALAHAQPRGCVPVPEWLLNRIVEGESDLWVIEMPTEAFPEVAKVGDLIICRVPSGSPPELVDGALYLFLMGK